MYQKERVSDFLRRSIQRFFARSLGERDFHAYEAVQLGLQLPLVIPMMPVVSLNTSGSRPLKPTRMTKYLGDGESLHYDSKVDKFNKRLELVTKQISDGIKDVSAAELQHLSMYEFWWKYYVERGRVKRSTRPVCLMVTPSYSADCANVEHACHESYARAAVLAHWRHMNTLLRQRMVQSSVGVEPVPRVCHGITPFVDPPVDALAPSERR